MAHNKAYAICENKCRVEIPIPGQVLYEGKFNESAVEIKNLKNYNVVALVANNDNVYINCYVNSRQYDPILIGVGTAVDTGGLIRAQINLIRTKEEGKYSPYASIGKWNVSTGDLQLVDISNMKIIGIA